MSGRRDGERNGSLSVVGAGSRSAPRRSAGARLVVRLFFLSARRLLRAAAAARRNGCCRRRAQSAMAVHRHLCRNAGRGARVRRGGGAAAAPPVYHFFVVSIAIFWLLLSFDIGKLHVARVFFVWIIVFSLFAVSVFWSFM